MSTEHCWHGSGGGCLKLSDGTYSNKLGESRFVCCWCGAKKRKVSRHEPHIPTDHGRMASWATDRREIVIEETITAPECVRQNASVQPELAEIP